MPELLSVSKKTIGQLFREMQEKKFIIPDFQRPYKWDIEKCETLWEDIEFFSTTVLAEQKAKEQKKKEEIHYFLGTIVTCPDEHGNLEIIDGQQRITSFFLILRAFYKKLENTKTDTNVSGLKKQIEPCIWDTDEMSLEVIDRERTHIESFVLNGPDNEVFHSILTTGEYSANDSDNYSTNYAYFVKKCDEYAASNPMQWKDLCITILHHCIVFPIVCDTPETALTIFSTLNDRGLPLADSDLFKAQFYRGLFSKESQRKFVNSWNELTSVCSTAGLSIDDIFRYYMHQERAEKGDKSKEVGLRKFYATNNYESFKQTSFMDNIMELSRFWMYINTREETSEEESYTISIEARKYLHCLSQYSNDFWKYVTSVFFLHNRKRCDFDCAFVLMLKNLTSFLILRFIEAPTVNAIKNDVYSACINIRKSQTPLFSYEKKRIEELLGGDLPPKALKLLLLLDAYLDTDQNNLIPESFDVEHILPKKWQNDNYNGWTRSAADECLERLGNKIVLEKKINISAGNGYFGKKKDKYRKSNIACVLRLAEYDKNDWLIKDINDRENATKARLAEFMLEQFS